MQEPAFFAVRIRDPAPVQKACAICAIGANKEDSCLEWHAAGGSKMCAPMGDPAF